MCNAVRASLAIAKVAGGSFVRAGALVGRSLTPHGMIQGEPDAVMGYRRTIDAWDVRVIADIHSQQFRWHGENKPTHDVARHAALVGADVVALGHPDESEALRMIADVRRAVPRLPILLAGHTTHENVQRLLGAADGAFAGTCLEVGGWGGPIDVERVRRYVSSVREIEQ
jgi:predicted TIM-barrel enzyme